MRSVAGPGGALFEGCDSSRNGSRGNPVHRLGCVCDDRIAVTDGDDVGLQRGETLQRDVVLTLVEVEGVPAGTELGPGRHRVADDRESPFRPDESEVPGGVARGVQDLKRPERVAFAEELVDRAGDVLGAPEPEPELEGEQPERLAGQEADRLGTAVAGDDVRLPGMGVDGGATLALELGEAAEVRAVPVRDRDPFQVTHSAAEPANREQDEPRVVLEQRVDKGELARVLDQNGSDVPTFGVAQAVDARRELSHAAASSPTAVHGANGFLTPSRAGASSGKWRRSTVRIEFDSTHSMPSAV